MNAFILYYLLLTITIISAVSLLVIWLMDLYRSWRWKRIGARLAPFMSQWSQDGKPKENRRV